MPIDSISRQLKRVANSCGARDYHQGIGLSRGVKYDLRLGEITHLCEWETLQM